MKLDNACSEILEAVARSQEHNSQSKVSNGPSERQHPNISVEESAMGGRTTPLASPIGSPGSPSSPKAVTRNSLLSSEARKAVSVSPKAIVKKFRDRFKLKTWLYILFAMAELIMIGAFLLLGTAGTKAVKENYKRSAVDAIGSVQAGYTQKLDHLSNSLRSLARNSAVQIFLQTGGSAAGTLELLQHVGATYQAEIVTLVGPDFATLLSANTNMTSTAVYNPANILAAAATKPAGVTVWTHTVISYAELLAQKCKLYRGRSSDLDPAYKGGHPFEYKGDSLIRYVAIPIYPLDLNTWVSSGTAPVGYGIFGDLASGKSGSTDFVASTLGGMAGLHHRVSSSLRNPTNLDAQWLTASASLSVRVNAGSGSNTHATNELIAGFSPLDSLAHIGRYLTDVFSERKGGATAEIAPYTMAVKPWTGDGEIEAPIPPDVILSRGLLMNDSFLEGSFTTQAIALAFIVALDMLMLLLAISLFVRPLEKMVKKVRAGHSVDINKLEKLSVRRYYSVAIAAIGFFSLLVGAWLQRTASDNIMHAVYARAAIGPGNVDLAWRHDLEGIEHNMAAFQVGRQTRGLLSNQSDTAKYTFMVQRLTYIEKVEQCEFVLLLNKTGNIIVFPNNPARVGEAGFNPADIVSDSLADGNRYTRTALIDWTDLAAANATVWQDKLVNTTPTSQLHPSTTKAQSLIRWTGTPIWIGTADHTVQPDGMIVSGQIVNGKTKIVELASKMILGASYSAVYYRNSDSKTVLAASALRTGTGAVTVDVPLPSTDWLDKLRLSATWAADAQETVTTEAKIKGQRYFLSARCVPRDTITDEDGTRASATDWSGAAYTDSECKAYLVQGLPYASVESTLVAARAWQGIFILFCCFKLLAISAICYKAYGPFKQVVIDNQFVRGRRQLRQANSPKLSSLIKSRPSNNSGGKSPSGQAHSGREHNTSTGPKATASNKPNSACSAV